MKMRMAAALLSALLTTAAVGQGGGFHPLHSDGTLPLRLPSDGTLPLRLVGSATATATSGTQFTMHVTINYAEEKALPDSASLACQQQGPTISRHRATGSLVVSNASYSLAGICFNHATRQMEVVAYRGGQGSFMAGPLQGETPSVFRGRMTITGDQQGGRYVFDTQRVNPQ